MQVKPKLFFNTYLAFSILYMYNNLYRAMNYLTNKVFSFFIISYVYIYMTYLIFRSVNREFQERYSEKWNSTLRDGTSAVDKNRARKFRAERFENRRFKAPLIERLVGMIM